jgi:iron(III)-enterobactin esterase
MFKPLIALLITVLASPSVLAQPPAREFDDPGAPPFKVLKEGENPTLDANDNFVIGPKYVPAPERKKVDGVPEGRVEQLVIDPKKTRLFNPGIARDKLGKVDPSNPKTLIVETHTIDYKRRVDVYIPAQYKEGTEAPFLVVHDGPGQANGYKTILDNLIHQKRIPPIILISIGNGGGDAQGFGRGKEYDNMNGD